MLEGKDCYAGGHERYDDVFVQGVALAEDSQVQEHHREELACFGEDEGDVVDVGEGGVAEGGGEGGRDGDEEEGAEDAAGGEGGGEGLVRGGREVEV